MEGGGPGEGGSWQKGARRCYLLKFFPWLFRGQGCATVGEEARQRAARPDETHGVGQAPTGGGVPAERATWAALYRVPAAVRSGGTLNCGPRTRSSGPGLVGRHMQEDPGWSRSSSVLRTPLGPARPRLPSATPGRASSRLFLELLSAEREERLKCAMPHVPGSLSRHRGVLFYFVWYWGLKPGSLH